MTESPPEFPGNFSGLLIIVLVAVLALMGRDIYRHSVVFSSGPTKTERTKTIVSAEDKPFIFWTQMVLYGSIIFVVGAGIYLSRKEDQ